MAKETQAYALPADPAPPGFICLKVFIPAADEYLYAFGGAYHHFTKWTSWQRDAAHNAVIAAGAWRQAYEKTMTEAWLNCGEGEDMDCCDEIAGIIERLEELENMNVNVNCGCGCAPAPCLPVSVVVPPPGTTPPVPGGFSGTLIRVGP